MSNVNTGGGILDRCYIILAGVSRKKTFDIPASLWHRCGDGSLAKGNHMIVYSWSSISCRGIDFGNLMHADAMPCTVLCFWPGV